MNDIQKLEAIREASVAVEATGLSDEVISQFLQTDPALASAIDSASKVSEVLREQYPELFTLPEKQLIQTLQSGILNFYRPVTVSPYVPLAAKGPWIITTGGAVIYDTGGYGMLGFGHDPDNLRQVLGESHVMANVMTPSFSQYRLVKKLKKMIGINRPEGCPFQQFIFMNSGSEAGTVATRITDAHAKTMTDPGGKHGGKKVRYLGLEGSFHGRTMRMARVSHSTLEKYRVLASFRKIEHLRTALPNDIEDLQKAFEQADQDNVYIEAMFLEPVMGEGNPGMAITPEFYNAARELTRSHDTLLVVDSIQAGFRAHGVLSIMDYPGFEQSAAPDMETFSKAVNGGQFPFSILALRQSAADCYAPGSYGNTMTTNPRGLEIVSTVLDSISSTLVSNVEERGKELVDKLRQLQAEFPAIIINVQGTGLLLSAELDHNIPVVGFDGVEMDMRRNGLNVIHGGANALRFTPHLAITSAEVDLIVNCTRAALVNVAKVNKTN
ncbi:aminotransferase class III-fold pyridoxal phosphate-dependent enzyme [Oligoflexia bacterium]|nr:aminotransferase class III-fold pyridoxal phosphate-dependent enzyme [Oligoflexia bacterium]